MARAVRVNVESGWYHVTAQGVERRAIFNGVGAHGRFLDLPAAMRDGVSAFWMGRRSWWSLTP